MNIAVKTGRAGRAPSRQTDVEEPAASRFPTRIRSWRRSARASVASSVAGTAPTRSESSQLPQQVSFQMRLRTSYENCGLSDQWLPPCHRRTMRRSDDRLFFAEAPYRARL